MEYKGIVTQGGRKATALGFPTINIPLADADVSGIFAGRVSFDGEEYPAVIYADQGRNVLEAHLFDFDRDLYGMEVGITLHKKIRDSKQFDTDEELQRAVANDIQEAKRLLS
jgi:riboflavin kinase/FMN adenylyltransferase